jgi:transcriptional regulator with XRE-family HTH domain
LISRHSFGSRLRTQRERRGVSLESIVDSTKIKLSLLESLERGDASQWPRGIYRRAHLRDYACAIGMPAEPLVAEFVKLFPEDGSPANEEMEAAAHEPMRMTFAVEPDTRMRLLAVRAGAALAELGAVVTGGIVLSYASGWSIVASCATIALVYYPSVATATGRVLSAARLRTLFKVHPAAGLPAVGDTEAEPVPLYLVPSRPQPSAPALVVAVGADEFSQPRTAAR